MPNEYEAGERTTDELNAATRAAWDANASFWDEVQGARGNQTQREVVFPATRELLALQPGQRLLELACGNGQFARAMAEEGVSVVACDFAPAMVETARGRLASLSDRVEVRVADVTDRAQLASLGEPGAVGGAPYDAAVCNMALMDIADVRPLFETLPELLAPGAPFVFSLLHPCFTSAGASLVAERYEGPGPLRYEHSLRIRGYKRGSAYQGVAVEGQPQLQWYFHRSLEELLGTAFQLGWALDGLREPTFPAGDAASVGPSWAGLPDVPLVLVGRLRVAGGPD